MNQELKMQYMNAERISLSQQKSLIIFTVKLNNIPENSTIITYLAFKARLYL